MECHIFILALHRLSSPVARLQKLDFVGTLFPSAFFVRILRHQNPLSLTNLTLAATVMNGQHLKRFLLSLRAYQPDSRLRRIASTSFLLDANDFF